MPIAVEALGKSFGEPEVQVLHDLSFTIEDGEFVALTGRSGSGKSTLLYLLGTLDAPTSGSVRIAGQETSRMDEEALHKFRNRELGFVFQFHFLLPELSAIENVLMPAMKARETEKRRPYAEELLLNFGLEGKFDRYPRQLSGGEQQRVAIARALVMNPRYLFADEPTGALDSMNGETVMRILEKVNREHKTTIILVTHDASYASRARRQIRLQDGRIV